VRLRRRTRSVDVGPSCAHFTRAMSPATSCRSNRTAPPMNRDELATGDQPLDRPGMHAQQAGRLCRRQQGVTIGRRLTPIAASVLRATGLASHSCGSLVALRRFVSHRGLVWRVRRRLGSLEEGQLRSVKPHLKSSNLSATRVCVNARVDSTTK
jgi:hypothetical protein